MDQIVSHYRIQGKLGEGGMGVVYKAEDIRLGRLVALKFLPENSAVDPRALERFKREARTASALDHPNICTIYEIDEDKGRPFIAMQLLEGQTLRDRIGVQPVPLGTLLDWGLQISDALQAAHAKGIMHRDIKPANIFITTREQAKILDFGLAKLTLPDLASSNDLTMSRSGPLTHTGAAIGTVAYMSPEQARGEPLDVRTDLFSFGVLLYEMATGKQAFSGPTWAVTVHAILGQAPVSLNESMPGLPQRLQQIIDKALVKNRELRYQTAGEIHADLLQLKKDYESGRNLRSTRTAAIWSPKRKLQVALAVCCVVLVIAGVLAHLFRQHRPELVFHAAAYKHVPLMERNPFSAIANNSIGTYRLVVAALEAGVSRLIAVSTDKAVNPLSVMGVSKRIAELVVLAHSTSDARMNVVRLCNVLGSSGSVAAIFQEQAEQGLPLTVTHAEAARYFLAPAEAERAILGAAVSPVWGRVLVPDCGEEFRILDLARVHCEAIWSGARCCY